MKPRNKNYFDKHISPMALEGDINIQITYVFSFDETLLRAFKKNLDRRNLVIIIHRYGSSCKYGSIL